MAVQNILKYLNITCLYIILVSDSLEHFDTPPPFNKSSKASLLDLFIFGGDVWSFWNQAIWLTWLLDWSTLFKNLLLIWICNYMFSLQSCKRLAHLTEAECSACRTGKNSIASASIRPCSLDEIQNLCMGRYFMKLI